MTRFACILVAACLAGPAAAHEWYPPACCSSRDCFALPDGAVTATPDGWRIEATGEVIPYDVARLTPPEGGGRFHRCTRNGTPDGGTLNQLWGPEQGTACFWAPQGGM